MKAAVKRGEKNPTIITYFKRSGLPDKIGNTLRIFLASLRRGISSLLETA
jgi:hypothetical protein